MEHGVLVSHCVLAILVVLCALAHLAVLRAPDIPESHIVEHVRWIKIAGFLLLSIRFWYVIFTTGGIPMPIVTVMGLTLIFSGELYRTIYRLFQVGMDAQYDARNLKGNKHAID